MADNRAQEIIALRDSEKSYQNNFRNLWQDVANLMFPRENQINEKTFPGQDKTRFIYDTTAILDSQDMASGLSGAMIPTGQKFFGFEVQNKELKTNDAITKYLSEATEITHEEMFASNFMLQLNETLRSLVVFGTGNLFSEWDSKRLRLNYKDFDVACYQIRENNLNIVDTVILTIRLTPRQAIQEFGEENVATAIVGMSKDPDSANKPLEFIHLVGPRESRKVLLSDNLNMPFESIFVDVEHGMVVRETGFEENPFAVARWMKSSQEKYGRGQGTEALPEVKQLQQMKRDFIECANKWNNPALEADSNSVEGQVNVSPGAINYVARMGSIRGIDRSAMGNFPITREALEFQQEVIHRAFFRDIFVQLGGLTGDRRTTVEIMERIREGLRRLALPVARLQSELFNPVIIRSLFLLIRNGRVPQPPPELEGQSFGVEYKGELALALQSQQANGFQQWAAFGQAMAEMAPEVLDNINMDESFRDMGRSFGVKEQHLATEEEVEAKREAREQAQAAAQAQELALNASEAYGKTNKAAEEGSPAQEVMETIGG